MNRLTNKENIAGKKVVEKELYCYWFLRRYLYGLNLLRPWRTELALVRTALPLTEEDQMIR